MKKPITLRVIFILNAIMTFLPFIFYYVFTTKNIQLGDLDPMFMVYTGIGYCISFALMVASILKKKITMLRAIIAVNVLIAIPASTYIGILFAIISMILSFTKIVKAYFNS